MTPEQRKKVCKLHERSIFLTSKLENEAVKEVTAIEEELKRLVQEKHKKITEMEEAHSFHRFDFVQSTLLITNWLKINGSPLSDTTLATKRERISNAWDEQILSVLITRNEAEQRIDCQRLKMFHDLLRRTDLTATKEPDLTTEDWIFIDDLLLLLETK